METTTQTNSHPNFSIAQGGVTIWSSDPEEQKAIDEAWDKISQDIFNTLSPEEQQEIKEIEKVINEGWKLKDRLTDPQLQKLCRLACKLAADYKFAKIYQHTSDGQEMLERFKANCELGLHPRTFDLVGKHLNRMNEGLTAGLGTDPVVEEEILLLEFLEKVNEWVDES